ncbi:helix-turn-helix domain-containing protein [Nocardia sp. NBC_01388]|uniref:helix-turn-helix domain-containing protein n=1 Tax=Nocardia sp. NBC_01388 TaxID=2903596 RepID=UPI00324CEF33
MPGSSNISHRLNELIDRREQRDGTRLTNIALVAQLGERGHRISKPYLSQLRTGKRREPSQQLLAALSELFEVSADYFTHGDAAPVLADAALVDHLHDPVLRRLLDTAVGLSAESLNDLNQLAEKFRDADRLPTAKQTATW